MRGVVVLWSLVTGSCGPVLIEGIPCADYEGAWRDQARSDLGIAKDHFYDDVAERFGKVENAIIQRCNNDRWSIDVINCRPGKPCTAELTGAQRKALDADLARLINGLENGDRASDACSRAFHAFAWRHSKGEAVGPLIWLQAVAPTARDAIVASCRDDHWSAEALVCLGSVTDHSSWNTCANRLDDGQRTKANTRVRDALARIIGSDPPFALFKSTQSP